MIFRRSLVRADSTVINLTAMDTGLRDYHFGSTPSIRGSGTYTMQILHMRARDDAFKEVRPGILLKRYFGKFAANFSSGSPFRDISTRHGHRERADVLKIAALLPSS